MGNLRVNQKIKVYIRPELHKNQPADVMVFHGKTGTVKEVHPNSILVEFPGVRVYLHPSECIKEVG
jgi:ribosomal protein L21E